MMRKHVGEKPHKSKQCKYTSTTFSDTLQIHMSTHTCEKPYKFDQCFTLVHKYIRCTRWHMLARRHTNDIGNDTIILIMIIAMIITAQRTQDIEYFDSFNIISSKQKLHQVLKSWTNFTLVLFGKGREKHWAPWRIHLTTLTNPNSNFDKSM